MNSVKVRHLLRYFYAVTIVLAALGARMLLLPLTGTGAPFVMFFGAVLTSAFLWGAGPGLLSGLVSTPIAAYLFVYKAHYSLSETIAQSTIFLMEISVICILANRFAKGKRSLEYSENTLRRTAYELRQAELLAHTGSWSYTVGAKAMEWSDGMYELLAWDRSKTPPSYREYPSQLYSPASAMKLNQAIDTTLRDGTPYEVELELPLSRGGRKYLVARAEALRNPSGQIYKIRGMLNDVTQLKALQRAREEWTSVIAHEIRQPIAVISMCAETLPRLRGTGASDTENRLWERVRSSARSLARMIDDLVDVSRMESAQLKLERSWTDPRKIVEKSLDHLTYLTKDFKVSFTQSGELGPIFVDPIRLEQVLWNLISNAAKYGKKGSEIRVNIVREDGATTITVTNEGRGIQPQEIPHLFNRYWRSENSRKSQEPGLGLGLYVTKGLVEAHGGTISATSVPEKETTFKFTIPDETPKQEYLKRAVGF